MSHRRLQAIPSRLSASNTLLASPLPKWLVHPIVERIHALNVFAEAPHGINHCLINEYLPGQGIMPHEDGPAYHPVVATVSLGAAIVLEISAKARSDAEREAYASDEKKDHQDICRILQEPRSLLLTTGLAYTDTVHGISNVICDFDLNEQTVANWNLLGNTNKIETAGGALHRETRISLTFRDVKKVSNIAAKLFGGTKR